uniref:Si:dkey-29p10.4 n=1 Tax=Sinocyclocheilus grahami TaxID=75366 RepID=A0A672QQU9_SINGR
MCPEHLRAHLEKPVFQNHPLVNAVEDVSLWRCQEHQEMNRIYCRSCAVCVCTVCSLVGSHKGHECISIRKAEQELRQLLLFISGIQQDGRTVSKMVQLLVDYYLIMFIKYNCVMSSSSLTELSDPLMFLSADGISPTLDPDTVHPKLLLSDENRTVQYSETQQDYPEQESRFNIFPQVLGSRAIDGGRCYWEVEVPLDEGRWKVGVCDGQIGRKGQKDICRIGFYPNSWCIIYEKGKVEALHDKVASPVCSAELWKIGVLLNFSEGRLSFYSVAREGSLSLLYSFEHTFTEPLYPALAVSKTQLSKM